MKTIKETRPLLPLLEIKNLCLSFQGGLLPAVRDFSLSLAPGELVGLVGESGSGKSLTALSLMGLLPPAANLDQGEILFQGKDLTRMNSKERRRLCGRHLGMVFQEPLTALNPVLTIGEQVGEVFRHHKGLSRAKAKQEAIALLGRVGLPDSRAAADNYPHRFSGGMRQRVVIAMALALSPEILIADEPTTALDPTIAAQILVLLKRMTIDNGSGVLFITHNLHLLAGLAGRVLVMYAGLILEDAPASELFKEPKHPYTDGLLKALPPGFNQKPPSRLPSIKGSPPVLGEVAPGCPFEPRCQEAFEACRKSLPELFESGPGRRVRCFLYGGSC